MRIAEESRLACVNGLFSSEPASAILRRWPTESDTFRFLTCGARGQGTAHVITALLSRFPETEALDVVCWSVSDLAALRGWAAARPVRLVVDSFVLAKRPGAKQFRQLAAIVGEERIRVGAVHCKVAILHRPSGAAGVVMMSSGNPELGGNKRFENFSVDVDGVWSGAMRQLVDDVFEGCEPGMEGRPRKDRRLGQVFGLAAASLGRIATSTVAAAPAVGAAVPAPGRTSGAAPPGPTLGVRSSLEACKLYVDARLAAPFEGDDVAGLTRAAVVLAEKIAEIAWEDMWVARLLLDKLLQVVDLPDSEGGRSRRRRREAAERAVDEAIAEAGLRPAAA